MKRRLIKQGAGGYTLYLPKKWADQRQLQAGDEVDVEETTDALIIRAGSRVRKELTILLQKETREEIYVKLSHAYRIGVERIVVRYRDPKTLTRIKEVCQGLLGFEVTLQEAGKCILENITEPTEEKYPVLLRRIFLQVKETYFLTRADLEQEKVDNVEEMKVMRQSVDKHIFFCRRMLLKYAATGSNTVLEWELLTFLMHMQHNLFYLYQYYTKRPGEINQKTKVILKELEQYLDWYYQAYFEKKELYLDLMQEQKNKTEQEIYAELRNPRNHDKIILAHLKELLRLVYVGGSPIRALLVSAELELK